jgi:hypothetical protein
MLLMVSGTSLHRKKRLFIPDPDSGSWKKLYRIGSRTQGVKKHLIPDPDPQHCTVPVFYRKPSNLKGLKNLKQFFIFLIQICNNINLRKKGEKLRTDFSSRKIFVMCSGWSRSQICSHFPATEPEPHKNCWHSTTTLLQIKIEYDCK